MRFFLLGIVLCLSAACKTSSSGYYRTPNDVLDQPAVVHMLSGAEKSGRITVNFETGRDVGSFIILNNESGRQKISLDSIVYYKIGLSSFHLKRIDVQLNDFKQLLFVKRLTADSSRVHLYELYQQRANSSDGRDYYYYFVSFPQDAQLAAQNISSKFFVPNFDEKVSAMFKNCMPVAIKIRNKESGYFLPAYTLSDRKKAAVWLRIISESNNCK